MQEGDVNPFTKQPHSAQYKKILEVRKKLPVFAQMQEFYDMVSGFRSDHERGRSESASGILHPRSIRTWLILPAHKFTENQIIVMVGETGSGKTTQ